MDAGSSPNPTAVKVGDDNEAQWTATDQGHNDKVVVEHKAPKSSPLLQIEGSAGKVWPFEGLCELLMIDLFDPVWEVRHGAALGLREVIRVHGAGAGRVMGKHATKIMKETGHGLKIFPVDCVAFSLWIDSAITSLTRLLPLSANLLPKHWVLFFTPSRFGHQRHISSSL